MVIDVLTGVGVGVREIRPAHYNGRSCVFLVSVVNHWENRRFCICVVNEYNIWAVCTNPRKSADTGH